ncbi:N-acetylmuramoyl-L-alanine amidase [Corynebacterium bovis]|uniref:N-acetylmuramoyl-L-alanine amidase n=1 Tax=Corynebacterium bovis TaxID=36808 RepID=UPI0021AB8E61|nr:N-acetylmuramoyl-L-alanine amidase [Corynebacterium bovis]
MTTNHSSSTRTRRRSGLILAALSVPMIAASAFAPAASAGADPSVSPGTESSLPDPAQPLAGRHIYLDPGHQAVTEPATHTVTDGRGGQKPCQAPGTHARDGWPEHTFTWLMGQELKSQLEHLGARVSLTRQDDTGPADCIDTRALKENASDADLVISIHADINKEGNRGFHVSPVKDPLPQNKGPESMDLAKDVRDGLVDEGFQTSNYLGVDGINPRDDLTGLNLSTKPKALVEFGNMQDSQDIAVLKDAHGRQRLAHGVVDGVESYLGVRGTTAPAS